MLFVLLAVAAFYAVLFCVGSATGVLAAIGWRTYAVRGRGRRFRKTNLGVNIGLSVAAVIALGVSVAWFAWFGGNIVLAGIQTAGER